MRNDYPFYCLERRKDSKEKSIAGTENNHAIGFSMKAWTCTYDVLWARNPKSEKGEMFSFGGNYIFLCLYLNRVKQHYKGGEFCERNVLKRQLTVKKTLVFGEKGPKW